LGLDHLRTSQLKLLLSSSSLSTDGSRDELLNRLREQVIVDVDLEWAGHVLHADTPIREDATLVEKDGDLYLFGGKDETSDIGSQELLKLSQSSSTWRLVENIGTWPERRYAHCAVVYNNKMYVWGGQRDCNSDRYFNDMHCFNFKTKVWHEVKQQGLIPDPRSYAKAVVHGKHMLLYGGVDAERGSNTGLAEFSEGAGTVLQFDFETNTWSQEKAGGPHNTKPLPIFIEAITVHREQLYAIVYDYRRQDASLQVYRLDLDKMKWHKIKAKGTAPSSRTRFAQVVLGQQWIIHGGLQQEPVEEGEEQSGTFNIPTAECFSFSFDTETWAQLDFVGRSPLARGGHAACELLGSMVLVGGHVPVVEVEDDESHSESGDDEDGESGSDSEESGYTIESDGEEAARAVAHEDEAHQPAHPPEEEEEEPAESMSSGGGGSGSGGGSRAESLLSYPADLKAVEVLQPRPTGPASDSLANVDLPAHLRRFCCADAHSDVVLVVDNKRFPAHRVVLAAQSEIFDAMLQGGMKEDTTGEVIVEDMRPDVMKSFISYLYGCLPAIKPEQAMDLFRASDRYGVHSLRTECLGMLQDAIDSQNAAAIAQLADEHQCSELADACVRFTADSENLAKVVASPAYMHLMRSAPELAQDFLRMAAELQAENARGAEGSSHRRKRKRRRAV